MPTRPWAVGIALAAVTLAREARPAQVTVSLEARGAAKELAAGRPLLVTRYSDWPKPRLPSVALPPDALFTDRQATRPGVRLGIFRLEKLTNGGATPEDVVKGELVASVTTPGLSMPKDLPGPGGPPPDRFVAELEAWLKVRVPGPRELSVTSDDGSWLWVDGERVIDNGSEHAMETKHAAVPLTEGMHRLRAVMFQSGGGYGLRVAHVDPSAEPPYLYRTPRIARIETAAVFGADGVCALALDEGRYRFGVERVLPDGTLVALTTGVREARDGARFRLEARPPAPVALSVKGAPARLDRLMLRLEGTLEFVSWRRSSEDERPPGVVLSPGERYRARLVGERPARGGAEHVVLWRELDPSRLSVDTGDTWVSECELPWDPRDRSRARNRVATLYTPEGWGLRDRLDPIPKERLFTDEAGREPGVRVSVRRLGGTSNGGARPEDVTLGAELVSGVDPEIALGLPGSCTSGHAENFVVEWNAWLRAPEAGAVTFATRSDDGSWLWVDDALVVENGGFHGLQTRSGTAELGEGMHRLRVRFFQGTGGYGLVAGTKPPAEDVVFPLEQGTRLVTNRRFVELSYAWDTGAGEHIEIKRRPFVLGARHEIACGGPLGASAYARVMGTWKSEAGSLAWGAELATPAGHVLHKMDYLPEHVKGRPDGYPSFVRFRQRYSDIKWSGTLRRLDGAPVPRDTERLTAEEREALGDPGELHRKLVVDVSYVYNGERVERTVPVTPFLRYESANWHGPGPKHWEGRMLSYLDKMERAYAIGLAHARRAPTPMIYRWYNHFVGAYTKYSDPIEMHMEWFGVRDRNEIYQEPDLLMHEMFHVQGYGHGAEHDRAVSATQPVFNGHHVYLADNPGYEPLPLTVTGKWDR